METTILSQKYSKSVAIAEAKTASANKLAEFWSTLEYNRFGLVPVLIVVVAAAIGDCRA